MASHYIISAKPLPEPVMGQFTDAYNHNHDLIIQV